MSKYRDFDALSFKSRVVHGDTDREHVNHITKKSMKDGSKLVGKVKFDPEQHREFITGFRKRKQQRRLRAMKELEEKARKERLQFRAEKREKMKSELGVADDWGLDEDKGEVQRKQPGVLSGEKKVYQAQGVTTTVSIVALDSMDVNEGAEEEEEQEERVRNRAEDFPSSSSMRPKKWRPESKPAAQQDEKSESKGKHQALTANTKRLQALLSRKKKGGGFRGVKKGAKPDKGKTSALSGPGGLWGKKGHR